MFVFLRVLIGLVFVVSGVEKLLSPYQNFLYVIQAYALVPSWVEELTARGMPWLEVFVGLFLVLGLWTQWALKGALLMFALFIVVVGQALMRGLPIDECGCFGALIHIPAKIIIVMDSFMLLTTYLLWQNLDKTQRLSLDLYFQK